MDIKNVNNITVDAYGYFDDLDFGIISVNSTLKVYADTFRCIGYYNNYNQWAIRYSGTPSATVSCTVGGTLPGQPNYFLNCFNGVYAYYYVTSVSILNNTFNGGYWGGNNAIRVSWLDTHSDFTVNNNIITYYNVGIFGSFNLPGHGYISGNNINHGVWCCNNIGVYIAGTGTYNVNDNTVTMVTGIKALGVAKANINNNNIWLPIVNQPALSCCLSSPPQELGISLLNSSASYISENMIKRTYPCASHFSLPCTSGTGIFASMSNNYSVNCNNIYNTDTAMEYSSPMTAVTVKNNNMYADSIPDMYGINFAHSGVIGTQGTLTNPYDNTWNIGGGGGFCNSSYFNASNPKFSQFWVRCYHCNYSPDIYYSCSPDTATEHIGIHSAVITLPPCPVVGIIQCVTCIHGFLDSIAIKRISFPYYPDTTWRIADYSLTTTIWENDSLLLDPILNHFNDSISGTSLGEIMAIDTSIFDSNSGVPLFDSLHLATLLLATNAIAPASNIEANLQTTTKILLQTILYQNYTLSAVQISTLMTLANKCPYQDGPGVYQARELLAEFNNDLLTVYSDDCSGHGSDRPIKRKEKQQDSSKPVNINIFPNPNNGSFTLRYNLGNEISGNVILFDDVGEKVGEYNIPSGSGEMQINNPNLMDGVYIYKLYTNSSIIKIGKIIVIK
jgi:hypothetical protein